MTTPGLHDEERRRYRDFATGHSEEEYRVRLADAYEARTAYNQDFYDNRLREPHILFAVTAARSLGRCTATTGYGGKLEISLNESLMFGTNPDWTVRPWPAEGTRRFIHDLLLRLTVRQFVLEVRKAEESCYHGFGPHFTAEANRIGVMLGLSRVLVRRRAADDADEPVAAGWPHNVRPAGYYGDDVTEALLDLATGRTNSGRRSPAPPSLGLLVNKKVERAQALLIRHIDRLQDERGRRRPVRRQVEEGKLDMDGSPLGEVPFDSCWLAWNNGTVRKVAEAIYELRAFGELPILADALEEAGCNDARILQHLRDKIEHTRRCWVLGRLLAVDAGGKPLATTPQAFPSSGRLVRPKTSTELQTLRSNQETLP